MSEDDNIDNLLAKYLELLDTYTSLRASVSELQSSLYQSLARANFSAERGVRYGQDFYDERMQASKGVIAKEDEDGVPVFDLVDFNDEPSAGSADTAEKPAQTKQEEETNSEEKVDEDEKIANDEDKPAPETCKPKSKDPLRWFGILAPPSLRQTQTSASRLAQTAVNIASVDAEMKAVEIEIRRARKRKAKNEKLVAKPEEEDSAKAEDGELGGVKQEPTEKEPEAKVNRGGGCGRVAK